MKKLKLKVAFYNSKLWGNFLKWASGIAVVFTTVLAFLDLCPKLKLIIFGCFLGTLVAVFVILLIVANSMTKLTLKINNSTVNIRFDDIFKQPESDLKVIAFNEYFDTKVDDVLISKSSLNGQYLLQLKQPIEELDELIANSPRMKERIAGRNTRRKEGKTVKYKLGSIYKHNDYLLVALTHFIVLTDNNKPSIFFEDLKNNPNITIEIGECSNITTVVNCPRCKTGRLVVRKNEERNRYFLGCSNYPQCDYTVNDTAVLEKPRKCRVCGGFMVERSGRYGKFYGCSNYPTCQHTEEINSSPFQVGSLAE